MHAESRICLGKLRMSTCEGPAEDRTHHPFFRPRHQKRHAWGDAAHVCAKGAPTPGMAQGAYCAPTFAMVFY